MAKRAPIIKAVILIFIFFLALGITFYIWSKLDKIPEFSENKNKESESSFNFYSSKKYGFSLEYPENWFKTADFEQMLALSSKQENMGGGGVPAGVRIELVVLKNYDNLCLEDFAEKIRIQGNFGQLEKLNEIEVGKTKAIKEKYLPLEGLVETGPPILVYLKKDDYIIRFKYMGREPDYTENLEVFERVLKSFKIF